MELTLEQLEQLPLDVEKFWAGDEIAHKDNCFNKDATQVALNIRMSDECVFAELGLDDSNVWGEIPREERIAANKAYNEKALQIVGRKLLREEFPDPDSVMPAYRQIGEVFGGEYLRHGAGGSMWLKGNCHSEEELGALLDKIDAMDIRAFILPDNWESEKKRIFEAYGKHPASFNGMRGPVTLATSIFGVEELIFLIYDEPELATRFSQTILRVIMEYIKIFEEESGQKACGFHFYDDDSNLLTPDMYELFGYPVLKAVFEYTSPNKGDVRYQHSDSAMGHLMPLLGTLNMTACNFGPTITVDEIRACLPIARIDGQLAPFTFMNNDKMDIAKEVLRDLEMAKKTRGVNIHTAGSINNGSSLESMRLIMALIQNFGQYN
ncbi:MAG: uroporphyrinogen decarboxylase family protein [Lachnospiraceae bacterium]